MQIFDPYRPHPRQIYGPPVQRKWASRTVMKNLTLILLFICKQNVIFLVSVFLLGLFLFSLRFDCKIVKNNKKTIVHLYYHTQLHLWRLHGLLSTNSHRHSGQNLPRVSISVSRFWGPSEWPLWPLLLNLDLYAQIGRRSPSYSFLPVSVITDGKTMVKLVPDSHQCVLCTRRWLLDHFKGNFVFRWSIEMNK